MLWWDWLKSLNWSQLNNVLSAVVAATVIAGLFGATIRFVWNPLFESLGRRRAQATKLDRLACGSSIAFIETHFGAAQFITYENLREQRTYRLFGAWVMIEISDDRVIAYSITITDRRMWYRTDRLTRGFVDVKLGKDKFRQPDEHCDGEQYWMAAYRWGYARTYYIGRFGAYLRFILSHNMTGVGDFDVGNIAQAGELSSGAFSADFDQIDVRIPATGITANTLTVIHPEAPHQEFLSRIIHGPDESHVKMATAIVSPNDTTARGRIRLFRYRFSSHLKRLLGENFVGKVIGLNKSLSSTWQKFKRLSLVHTASSFSLSTRILLSGMFVFGVCLLIVLTCIDLNVDVRVFGYDLKRPDFLQGFDANWMQSHAYLPNIFAGITGFFIGVPFALVVLATFTVEREQNSARRTVERLSENAWRVFSDAVMDLCSDARIDAVTTNSKALHDAQMKTFKAMNYFVCTVRQNWDYRAYMLGDSGSDVISRDPSVHLASVRESLPNFKNSLDTVIEGLGSADEIETLWSTVKGSWNVLDQYVRIQMLESSIEWFDPTDDALFRRDMRIEGNPIHDIVDKIGEFDIWTDTSSNVRGDYAYTENITMVDDDVKIEFVMNNTESFGYSANYLLGDAESAASFLQGLRSRVEGIRDKGWPGAVSFSRE
ncbi:hypothetical protein SAMN04488581_3618 [Mycolicibacterium neoaurum]|uniref:ETEC_3214 domain-containing protein n=1 Tax=Mycolicibacterium neoaurum TaxID=1795 RepID=UPI0008883C0F|nr:ETEC_3214 domain-containing protein [Mycolicibacterium neoaurum]SDE22799.1 hypothetical protein SAMN04488581_3618 [Mycolicibacterium neoaurum]